MSWLTLYFTDGTDHTVVLHELFMCKSPISEVYSVLNGDCFFTDVEYISVRS